eukprot:gene13501-biopygen12105
MRKYMQKGTWRKYKAELEERSCISTLTYSSMLQLPPHCRDGAKSLLPQACYLLMLTVHTDRWNRACRRASTLVARRRAAPSARLASLEDRKYGCGIWPIPWADASTCNVGKPWRGGTPGGRR